MKVRLFTIPASHPIWAARLMLEHKAIAYKRVDLVAVASKGILRAARFDGVTVPALILDGKRVQGTLPIALALDEAVPQPPLVPAGGEARARVLEAERWGDEVLQPVPRRLAWNVLRRDRSPTRSYLEGAKLGIPISVAAATSAPIAALAARFNEATDENVLADLGALPEMIDHVEKLIDDGVIGTDEPNVADFQVATSIALLLTFDDIRPLLAGRPAEELARRLVPGFPGHSPPVLPSEWLEPLSAARA